MEESSWRHPFPWTTPKIPRVSFCRLAKPTGEPELNALQIWYLWAVTKTVSRR
jgi:hypothetical protein